jgi:uncharacterized Zn finger protein
MSSLPQITEQTIRSRVGERHFKAGKEYAHSGAITDSRRQGLSLFARCKGSRSETYHVEATFDTRGVARAFCSCPIGRGGRCKHVAALLLTWRANPERFGEVEGFARRLQSHDKEELIALIEQMIRQQPDLELLLDTLPPPASKPRKAARPEAYQRQAAALLQGSSAQDLASSRLARELLTIKQAGDNFLQKQDYASAAAVYEGVGKAVVTNYETVPDEEGHIARVACACLASLGQCLAAGQLEVERRQAMLRTLFEAYRLDVNLGGVGLGENVPALVMRHATPEERRQVADWVRGELASVNAWGRHCHGSFLIELEADTLEDEAFLQLCRDTGHKRALVERLLQRGRLEDALREAEQAEDHVLLGLADLFLQYGKAEVAERLLRERSQQSQNLLMLAWLKNRHALRNDAAAVLGLAVEMFRLQPNLAGYQEIRPLAQELQRWEVLRPSLLDFLKKSSHPGLLIQVYLDEGEIDEALAAVRSEGDYNSTVSMALEVAGAAEKTRPREALDIYRRHAEGLIALHGRENYRSACYFLEKVRDLYHRLRESEAWTSYVTELREQHQTLRAFQEELTTAKL